MQEDSGHIFSIDWFLHNFYEKLCVKREFVFMLSQQNLVTIVS